MCISRVFMWNKSILLLVTPWLVLYSTNASERFFRSWQPLILNKIGLISQTHLLFLLNICFTDCSAWCYNVQVSPPDILSDVRCFTTHLVIHFPIMWFHYCITDLGGNGVRWTLFCGAMWVFSIWFYRGVLLSLYMCGWLLELGGPLLGVWWLCLTDKTNFIEFRKHSGMVNTKFNPSSGQEFPNFLRNVDYFA